MIKKFKSYNKLNESLYKNFVNDLSKIHFKPDRFNPYDLYSSLADIHEDAGKFFDYFLKWYLTGRNILFKAMPYNNIFQVRKSVGNSYFVKGKVEKVNIANQYNTITVNNKEHVLLIAVDIEVYDPDPDALLNFLNYLADKESDIEKTKIVDPYGEDDWFFNEI